MDPNRALSSILCGHMVAEHVYALSGWLRSGGFEPKEQLIPVDKHKFFADHCERVHGHSDGIGIRVKANTRGIWTYSIADNDWLLAGDWKQLAKLEDSEY